MRHRCECLSARRPAIVPSVPLSNTGGSAGLHCMSVPLGYVFGTTSTDHHHSRYREKESSVVLAGSRLLPRCIFQEKTSAVPKQQADSIQDYG